MPGPACSRSDCLSPLSFLPGFEHFDVQRFHTGFFHWVKSTKVSPCLFKSEKRPVTWETVSCHPLTCWWVALLGGPQRRVQVLWTPRG